MTQRSDIAPVDLVGVGVEMIVVKGLNAGQHLVDPGLGGEEGFEGFVVRGVGAASCHGVIACSAGCGLASGEGRFQCGAD